MVHTDGELEEMVVGKSGEDRLLRLPRSRLINGQITVIGPHPRIGHADSLDRGHARLHELKDGRFPGNRTKKIMFCGTTGCQVLVEGPVASIDRLDLQDILGGSSRVIARKLRERPFRLPDLRQDLALDDDLRPGWNPEVIHAPSNQFQGFPQKSSDHLVFIGIDVTLGHGPQGEGRMIPDRNGDLKRFALLLLSPKDIEIILFAMAITKDTRKKKEISQFLIELRKTKTFLKGRDLKKLGIAQGPLYSIILGDLLDEKLRGRLKTEEDEKRYVQSRYVKNAAN